MTVLIGAALWILQMSKVMSADEGPKSIKYAPVILCRESAASLFSKHLNLFQALCFIR